VSRLYSLCFRRHKFIFQIISRNAQTMVFWMPSFIRSSIHPFIHQWPYRQLFSPGLFFSFLIFYTGSRTPWTSIWMPSSRSIIWGYLFRSNMLPQSSGLKYAGWEFDCIWWPGCKEHTQNHGGWKRDAPRLGPIEVMKMGAACSSETSISTYKTTRYHNMEKITIWTTIDMKTSNFILT
jgi:hypothetical protein